MIAQKYKDSNNDLIKVIPKKERYYFYIGVFFLVAITLSAVMLAFVLLDVLKFLKLWVQLHSETSNL